MSCCCQPALIQVLQDEQLSTRPPPLRPSPAARAADALRRQMRQGVPDLPRPEGLTLPNTDPMRAAAATAWSQVERKAEETLGIDPTDRAAGIQVRRMSATLGQRLVSMQSSFRSIDLSAWLQLADLNRTSQDLERMLAACLAPDDEAAPEEDGGDDPMSDVAPPAAWGGDNLRTLRILFRRMTAPSKPLTPEAIAGQADRARRIGAALTDVRVDVTLLSQLAAGTSSMLSVRTGERHLTPAQQFQAARENVVQNFRRMSQLAETAGIDLSRGPDALPPPGQIPRYRRLVQNSLRRQVRELDALPPAVLDPPFSLTAPTEVSFAAVLYLTLSLASDCYALTGITVLHSAPCASCDLREIMAVLDAPGAPSAVRAPSAIGAPAVASAQADDQDDPATDAPDSAPSGSSAPPAPGASAPTGAASPAAAPAAAPAAGGGGGGGVPATVMTAELMCSFGIAPSVLTVLPINRTTCGKQVAANIMDHIPMVNIMPFGMCTSIANPEVASATAAALGVLTPMPCIPATAAPWMPGAPTVMLGQRPMLDATSTCLCTWAGEIMIVSPGQVQTTIP